MFNKKMSTVDKECDKALCQLASGDKTALSVIYDNYGRLIISAVVLT